MSKWTPVCEVCHGAPKMDRSVCCESCWYSGAYSEWSRPRRRAASGGLSPVDPWKACPHRDPWMKP